MISAKLLQYWDAVAWTDYSMLFILVLWWLPSYWSIAQFDAKACVLYMCVCVYVCVCMGTEG